jgi:hypothetical protein
MRLLRNLAMEEVGEDFDCSSVNTVNHEDPDSPIALVYSIGALLAAGHRADFYSSNPLANSIAISDHRVHH